MRINQRVNLRSLIKILFFARLEWGKEYPQCAQSDTVQQSPIDVEKSSFQNLETIIMFEKYDADESFIVVNNGHGGELLFYCGTFFFFTDASLCKYLVSCLFQTGIYRGRK